MSRDWEGECWPSTSLSVYVSSTKIRRGKGELGGCPMTTVHEGAERLHLRRRIQGLA